MSNTNYVVLGSTGKELIRLENVLHPGYLIEMESESRGFKKQDIAMKLGIKPQHLSELIHEKRNVSALLALKLEQVFGIDAEYWLRVQSGFDLALARKKLSDLNATIAA